MFNQARDGSVTGRVIGSIQPGGVASITAFPDQLAKQDSTAASKLRVGPSFLAPLYSLLSRVGFGACERRRCAAFPCMRPASGSHAAAAQPSPA